MRVGIITSTFPPYHGGTGNVAYNHAIELAKLGHKVTVFTQDYGNYEYPKSIIVKKLKPLFKIGNAPFLPGLLRIRKKDFDILHLHHQFYFGAETIWLLSKIKNVPYVMTYQMDTILKNPLQLLVKIHNKTMLKLILKQAKKVIVSSKDYAKHSVIKNFTNITEIPNGVDIKKFNPENDPKKVREKHNIKNKIVLFVGTLDKAHHFKGIDILLKSFKDVNATLLIVGEGNKKEDYIKKARKLKICDKTIFAGKIENKELPQYYAACDLLVLPSTTMGEAFGLVLLEAMATGKPTITSNLPGIRKTAEKASLLAEPKNVEDLTNKINHLLEKESLREELGKSGRKKVEKQYSWKKIAKKLETVYKSS